MDTSPVRLRVLVMALGAIAWAVSPPARPQAVISAKDIVGGLTGDMHPAAASDGSSDEGTRAVGIRPVARPDEEPPATVNLEVPFELDSDRLRPDAAAQLDELAAALANPALISSRIEIVGHTDSSGAADYNRKLSQKRAQAVLDYLAAGKGVDSARLAPIGRGEEDPIPGTDPASSENRRVEIRLVGGQSP